MDMTGYSCNVNVFFQQRWVFLDRFCFLSEKGELAFDFVFPLVSSAIAVGSVHHSTTTIHEPVSGIEVFLGNNKTQN